MRLFFMLPKIFGVRPVVEAPLTRRTISSGSGAGFIYVVSGDHRLAKIGITTNPQARLATLRTSSPFPIEFAYVAETSGAPIDVEQNAHAMLDRHRCQGEWFDVAPEAAVGAIAAAAHAAGQTLRQVDPNAAIPAPVRPPSAPGHHATVAVIAIPLVVLFLGWVEIAKLGVEWPVAAIANGLALILLGWGFRALARVTG